jgi:hypothetical protein
MTNDFYRGLVAPQRCPTPRWGAHKGPSFRNPVPRCQPHRSRRSLIQVPTKSRWYKLFLGSSTTLETPKERLQAHKEQFASIDLMCASNKLLNWPDMSICTTLEGVKVSHMHICSRGAHTCHKISMKMHMTYYAHKDLNNHYSKDYIYHNIK